MLDRCNEILAGYPLESIPIGFPGNDYMVINMVTDYYRLGRPEKARALAAELADELQKSASFYFNFYDWASEEFETAGYYIYMLADELKKGGDTELAAGITARFSDMIEAAGV